MTLAVNGILASEWSTRFWATRFTYSVTCGSSMNFAWAIYFSGELPAECHLFSTDMLILVRSVQFIGLYRLLNSSKQPFVRKRCAESRY